MTAYDFSFVRNTSIAFDATADSINLGALNASDFVISESGGNLTLRYTNGDFVTLQGTTLGQLTATNVLFGGGTTAGSSAGIFVGDLANTTLVDNIANTLNEAAPIKAAAVGASNLFYGMGGADTITTGNGNNVVFGGSSIADTADGNDTIALGSGNNTLYANAGNDAVTFGTVTSAGNTTTAYMGIGDDSLTSGAAAGNLHLFGNSGNDTFTLSAQTGDATVYGGNGIADSTDGNDTIALGTGSATVYANSGNDIINTAATAAGKTVTVYAGTGNDSVTSGAAIATANHVFFGNSGDDTLNAGGITAAANVTIYGGNGVADSTDGADVITTGDDAATTTVYGNSGNDTINVSSLTTGTATVYTGTGDDVVNIATAGAVTATTTIHLAAGNETVNFDALGGQLVTINGFSAGDIAKLDMSANTASMLVLENGFLFHDVNNDGSYAAATEEAINFASLATDFTSTNLLITEGGIGGASVGLVLTNLYGAAAATLTGAATADLLVSGSFGDTLVGGGGVDRLIGNGGNDVFQLTSALANALDANAVTLSGGSGTDTLEITGAAANMDNADFIASITSVETIKLANFTANTLVLAAGATAAGVNTVDMSAVTAGTSSTTASALATSLTYTGGASDDTLVRGAAVGSDNIDLGGGNDLFTVDIAGLTSADTVIGGTGSDGITFTSAGAIADVQFTNVSLFETLTLHNGANTLTGGAELVGSGITAVTGNANTDVINMSALTTSITIDGGAGADTLTGGSAVDSITGGADADSITGGGGADFIALGAAGDIDTLNYNAAGDFGDQVTGADISEDIFTFANTLGDGGLVGAVTWVADAANLGALTTAANADGEGFVVEDVALTTAGYALIDSAMAAGTMATGAGFVLADNGVDSALLYDSDFSTTGNMVLVAYLSGVADASGGVGITIL